MWRRYALIRQDEQGRCGAAVLATIALHHGIRVSPHGMRDLAATDQGGADLASLLPAAEAIGLSAKPLKGSYDSLSQVALPAVVSVLTQEGRRHLVVIHRVRNDSVVVADPAHGVTAWSRAEFCARWTGHLLVVVPRQEPRRATLGAIGGGPWHRLLLLLGPHTTILMKALFCALLMMMLGVATSYFVKYLVDSVLVRSDGRLLDALGARMLLIVLLRTLFSALREYLIARVGRNVGWSRDRPGTNREVRDCNERQHHRVRTGNCTASWAEEDRHPRPEAAEPFGR
jgi:ABC-type bacteriocin/lantibiotic exporter with double-glycine peptidase domain